MKTCRKCGSLNGDARNDCYNCKADLRNIESDFAPLPPVKKDRSPAIFGVIAALVVIVVAVVLIANRPKSKSEIIKDAFSGVQVDTRRIDAAIDAANQAGENMTGEREATSDAIREFREGADEVHNQLLDLLDGE